MKKKTLFSVTIMIIVLGLVGCIGRRPINSNNTYDDTEEVSWDVEDNTEDEVEDDTEEVDEVEIPSDYTNFENVYLYIGDEWEYHSSESDTHIYKHVSGTESFAIYVQNETMYSDSDLYKAYDDMIISTFGEDYTSDSYDDGDRIWVVYRYDEGNKNDSTVCTDVYVYSNGDTTIYIENSYVADTSVSYDILNLIDSIIIED